MTYKYILNITNRKGKKTLANAMYIFNCFMAGALNMGAFSDPNKTIADGGITGGFWIIKDHTTN